MLLARDDVPARLHEGSRERLQAVPRVDVGTREPGEYKIGVPGDTAAAGQECTCCGW